MSSLRFEWDEAKNEANQRKHGVSFQLASQVFDDPLHLTLRDRVKDGEERLLTFGTIESLALLVVAHTQRESDEDGEWTEIIRIISAREVTKKEKRFYEEETG